MRTVQLIQFTNPSDSGFGYHPNMNVLYKVNDLEDTYYYEEEDNESNVEDSELDSISILLINRRRHVVKTDELKYNLLTIELEDNSQLFK